MKLLHEFFCLCRAGVRAASVRSARAPRPLNVTVPAPLASAAQDGVVLVELPLARLPASRREPASFLKAARHRRLSAGH